MKWILIAIALAVIYAIITGNMGGAQNATSNYNKILTGKPAANR